MPSCLLQQGNAGQALQVVCLWNVAPPSVPRHPGGPVLRPLGHGREPVLGFACAPWRAAADSDPRPSRASPLQPDPTPSPVAGSAASSDGAELEVIPPPVGAGEPTRPSASRVAAGWVLALSVAAVVAAAWQFASEQTRVGFFLPALCFVVVFGATWSDVATRRIPNALTYPAIVLGLALNAGLPLLLESLGRTNALVFLGSSGTLDALQGFGVCAAIGIVSFMARGLGGGDVKLLGAVGAMLGLHMVVGVLFNTLLIAAFLGIVNWFAGGSLMQRLQSFAHAIYFSVVMKADMRSVYRFRPTEGPFALSLLLGLVLAHFVALHREIFGVTW